MMQEDEKQWYWPDWGVRIDKMQLMQIKDGQITHVYALLDPTSEEPIIQEARIIYESDFPMVFAWLNGGNLHQLPLYIHHVWLGLMVQRLLRML
jgi:hypothetical protein